MGSLKEVTPQNFNTLVSDADGFVLAVGNIVFRKVLMSYPCFAMITYRLVTPTILFFCIADTTPALKRSDERGACMIWVSSQPL